MMRAWNAWNVDYNFLPFAFCFLLSRLESDHRWGETGLTFGWLYVKMRLLVRDGIERQPAEAFRRFMEVGVCSKDEG